MKIVTMILFFVFTGNHLYAQQNVEADIVEIRGLYTKAQEYITFQSKANAPKNQLQVTTQKSWIDRGNQTDNYNFYFYKKDGDLGEDGNSQYRLSFVRIKSDGAVRKCSEEYLFNDRGELVFSV